MASQATDRATGRRSVLLAVAWGATLLASALPEIVCREILRADPSPILWWRIGLLAALLALSLAWKAVRPLWGYLALLLVIQLADGVLRPSIAASPLWQGWFAESHTPWSWSNLGVQFLRLLPALAAWLLLAAMGLKRPDYFLVKGRIDAPVEPVRWLSPNRPESWARSGREWALILGGITLALMVLGARPSLSTVVAALPLLPGVLLFAAMNAFMENFTYRAGPLSQLLPIVGKSQALLLTAVLFGLMHFYGIPAGVGGVLLAGFLGWLLGKSMAETRGFFWAWVIQFPMDVIALTFAFALAAVAG